MSQEQEILEPGIKTPLKKRSCLRGCLLYCGLFLLIAAFPFWWFCVGTPPIRISKETTYITGPLAADGRRIDYFRDWEERTYPPEMKTDENGYRLFVRACGDTASRYQSRQDPETGELTHEKIDPEPYRLQVYEKLGLDPAVKPTLKLESPDMFWYRLAQESNSGDEIREKQQAYQQRDKLLGRFWWTFEDFPELRQWYEENGAALDLLAEALRKPAFRIPSVRLDSNQLTIPISLGENQMTREWVRALEARTYCRIGIGEIDGAIEDVLTLYRLSRHLCQGGGLIDYLVAVVGEGMGEQIEIGANPAAPPSRKQIERLLQGVENLPPRMTMSEAFKAERYSTLSYLQTETFENGPDEDYGFEYDVPLPILLKLGIDWNIILEKFNKGYDLADARAVLYVWDLFFRYEPRWTDSFRMLTVRGRSELLGRMLVAQTFSPYKHMPEIEQRYICMGNLKCLTLALLLYEKDHGRLPGEDVDWREAVKPYLGPEPEKYFRCPSHHLAEGETAYAMIAGVENPSPSPDQILIVEVVQPQKLGEGNGRISREKAKFWQKDPAKQDERRPDDFDGLGSYHFSHLHGGIFAGCRNGTVRALAEATEPEKLEMLIEGTATATP